MNSKTVRIIYYTSTGLLSLLMAFGASMYFIDYENVSQTFIKLGYPSYIIYPLATAKILGLLAIWTKKSNTLKEWAYAGFFFNFLLAITAHININDGEYSASFIAIILLLVSYIFEKKMNN